MTAFEKLETWTTSQSEEDAMFQGHFKLWQTMIEHVQEKDLRNKTVLDYGCNQGGYLRMLYNIHPFAKATGVDIAAASLNRARELSPGLPITFAAPDILSKNPGQFDIAFSHEVIYLLQDLNAHAELIGKSLKPGGVYYAATGCHTENPLWPQWRKLITGYSNIPVPDYSLDNYAKAFAQNGFQVSLKPFSPQGFITTDEGDADYYPRLIDKVKYYHQHKILFRFAKI